MLLSLVTDPPQPYSHIKTVPHSHGPLIWTSICLPAAAGLFSAPLLGEQKGHSCQGHGLSMTALPTAILPRGFQAGEGRGPLKCLWCHCTRGCPFCPQSRPLTDHSKNAHTSLPLLAWGLQGGGGLTPDHEIPKPARAHTFQSAIKTHQALCLGIQDSLFPPDQLWSGLYHFLFRLLE